MLFGVAGVGLPGIPLIEPGLTLQAVEIRAHASNLVLPKIV